ncbi:hypothetical protein GALMADRAFT_144242 [Galerina marginata CBS 339.88]|uniref:Uncharacterized protein n=1 Tax=Galerina marginata (strain CBS 339.88) TaxID=685588 RepID=A0A067SJU2_GALM3|nr:hypothetical protein GALMADRAFT_144242 [Galerina marginata CBS 339.88]
MLSIKAEKEFSRAKKLMGATWASDVTVPGRTFQLSRFLLRGAPANFDFDDKNDEPAGTCNCNDMVAYCHLGMNIVDGAAVLTPPPPPRMESTQMMTLLYCLHPQCQHARMTMPHRLYLQRRRGDMAPSARPLHCSSAEDLFRMMVGSVDGTMNILGKPFAANNIITELY